jgi:hypothetical protein
VNTGDLKRIYGDEYPATVVVKGVKMALYRETRFSRSYNSKEPRMGCEVSRFMDGSASIMVGELQSEWPAWTDEQRLDFCQSCAWLNKQSDFPDMLRYIMKQGGQDEWSGIANSVASALPCEEAFQLLLGALHASDAALGSRSNIVQGIAITKYQLAETTLRQHLQTLWENPVLWNNDKFVNWPAYDATMCIAHLIELGASAADFEDQVRKLSQHVCPGNRDSCHNFLSKHYAWLK